MGRIKRILVLHPKCWSEPGFANEFGVVVKHVSIGGSVPKRATGEPTWDGIGDVATDEGQRELISVAQNFRPDIFLFGIHFNLHKQTIRALKIRSPNTKIVMHYTDQRETVSKFIKPYIGLLDAILVTNKDALDHQKYYRAGIPKVGVFYDGFDPREYWPMPSTVFCEVLFGGNNFRGLERELRSKGHEDEWIGKFDGAAFREEFLLLVNQCFNLIVRGSWGWDREVFDVKPMRYHPNYLKVMREAKVVLNTLNVFRYGLLTRRLFRSMASGRLYVSQYCPGFEDVFKNHVHLVWFNSMEEGLDVLRFYLDNDTARETIASTGRKYLVDNFTFKHRLGEFVRLCEDMF